MRAFVGGQTRVSVQRQLFSVDIATGGQISVSLLLSCVCEGPVCGGSQRSSTAPQDRTGISPVSLAMNCIVQQPMLSRGAGTHGKCTHVWTSGLQSAHTETNKQKATR